jgi:dienelactone hydrolase
MPEYPPPTLQHVAVRTSHLTLNGDLTVPADAAGIIVFAHGSGSGRRSPRNQRVAGSLARAGFATLLLDLLTEEEEVAERYTAHLRFDIPLLADRLVGAIEWVRSQPRISSLPVGLFGASTGAAAALIAATRVEGIGAVVSRGGRPDLADQALRDVHCPTLLIVGADDPEVIELNRRALQRMVAPARLRIVPGATHLFEEPGALEEVAHLASNWFQDHLGDRRIQQPHETRSPA